MKIFHVLNHFLPDQIAGTEVYVWALTKELKKNKIRVGPDKEAFIEIKIVIPNYGKTGNEVYDFDGINVIKYAEPSTVNRSLRQGKRKPDSLLHFIKILETERPDIVHFHEVVSSRGNTIHHVQSAKDFGAKVVMTFHLAGYTCRTGNLVFKEQKLCDGIINVNRCSHCYLQAKGFGYMAPILVLLSSGLQTMGFNTVRWNSKLGTALGTTSLIKQFQHNFQKLTQLCDKMVTLTRWYEKILKQNGVNAAKISYIPQGLPFEINSFSDRDSSENFLPIRLMFLGRISPLKGLHLLIEAIKNFPETDIELDIYGQPADYLYEQQCRSKSINKINIRWKGKLLQQDVVRTMRRYDALCLCSTFSEMSPLVIQEAFAAGIPVIASNVYGNAEQVEHGVNGLLFRFKDVDSLRQQIQRCIDHPDILKSMAQQIKPPVNFSVVGDAYIKLYQKLFASS
ncbi:MAG TPA: glycosyltransferase [Chitinophagaceae bacterium]|nr:glycosyltransferase [Chitinophagaceae bacterium]